MRPAMIMLAVQTAQEMLYVPAQEIASIVPCFPDRVEHLRRYEVECPGGPEFLIRPEVFTQEELDLFGRGLSAKDGRVDAWVVDSGGIGGEARGLHADWLKPGERVRQAVAELLGVR